MNSTAPRISHEQAKAIRNVIEREQDRILLKLRTAHTDVRPHLVRMLEETKIALSTFEPQPISGCPCAQCNHS